MTTETATDVRAKVETILGEVRANMKRYKHERDNPNSPTLLSRSSYDVYTGKIRGMAEVLDVFAELGFSIGPEA